MTKAVFFDWSNTLARYFPSREELQSQAINESGFTVSPSQIAPGLALADRYLFEETSVSPLRRRSPQEQGGVYTRYQQMVLTSVGAAIPADSENFKKLMGRLNELYAGMKTKLFDDVLPAMKMLKQHDLVLALVTNMDADMGAMCRELGLAPYLDFSVTSSQAGSSKPQPGIFKTALEYAGVKASEAVHVGDQPDIDVAGAIGAGVRPVLIDRDDLFPEFAGCPRVRSLTELAEWL